MSRYCSDCKFYKGGSKCILSRLPKETPIGIEVVETYGNCYELNKDNKCKCYRYDLRHLYWD